MPLTYNMAQGGIHYAPMRDFAHNYPAMVQSVIRAFNNEYWKGLLETLDSSHEWNGSADDLWDEVCRAKDCFCEFLNICTQDPSESLEDVLKRSGFTATPMHAQVAWMAMLGQVVTGQLFTGVRDITLEGQQHHSINELLKSAHDCRRILNHGLLEKDHALVTAALQNAARVAQDMGMSQNEVRKIVNDTLAETRLKSDPV